MDVDQGLVPLAGDNVCTSPLSFWFQALNADLSEDHMTDHPEPPLNFNITPSTGIPTNDVTMSSCEATLY